MTTPIAEDLNSLLADYQVLYQKLRSYHWNVTGPQFFALHAKFMELYTEAAERVDSLAERVAALGSRPLSTLAGALERSRLKEDKEVPKAEEMVRRLISDYLKLNHDLRVVADKAANDRATLNMLDAFADSQEKTVWMLKAGS